MKSDGHVTIEKTAKRFKLQKVLSALGIFVSFGWALVRWAGSSLDGKPLSLVGPAVLFGISAAWYLITRVRIWWNHG